MITITYEKFIEALALFTAMCVAGGWLIKIVHGIKAPAERKFDYLNKAVAVLMKSNLAMLGHMATDNNTGELRKAERELQEFLVKNQS